MTTATTPGTQHDPQLCRQNLEQLFGDETGNLTRLEALLQKEQGLLKTNDMEAIEQAGAARQTCIGELLRIEDERRGLCRMLGYTADASGMQELMRWCDPRGSLLARWAECRERALRCRGLNDRNGAVVAAKLKRVEGLLGVLTGSGRQPAVYTVQGTYSRPAGGHILAEA